MLTQFSRIYELIESCIKVYSRWSEGICHSDVELTFINILRVTYLNNLFDVVEDVPSLRRQQSTD